MGILPMDGLVMGLLDIYSHGLVLPECWDCLGEA